MVKVHLEGKIEPGREHLKKLRMQRGYTQQEVADLIGVTKSTISKYENGQRQINKAHLKSLSELYGVSVVFILFGSDFQVISEDVQEENFLSAEKENESEQKRAGGLSLIHMLTKQLNEEGLKKAVERIKELTEVPKYQRKEEERHAAKIYKKRARRRHNPAKG